MKKLIVFSQKDCIHCDRLEIHLQALQQLMSIEIAYIDITNNWDVAKVFEFTSTPAVFVLVEFDPYADIPLTAIEARTTLALMKELGNV